MVLFLFETFADLPKILSKYMLNNGFYIKDVLKMPLNTEGGKKIQMFSAYPKYK